MSVKAVANEDTLLRTHCCRHKCFPVCPRAQHLLRTQILSLFSNILCLQQMFPSLRIPRNIMGNNVSAAVCPRLPGPLENFLTINKFFSAKLEKKGNHVYNHPASNPEPLFPNIPFIPLHYQVDPPIFRKISLQSVIFLNVNDRVAPNNK